MGAAVTGCGMALPERVLTNEELVARIGVTPEWIVERTGVRERRVVGEGETSSSLATEASARALADAGLPPAELGDVIVATVTPDYQFPAVASLVQARLGASAAGAYDVAAACSGFLYALAQAQAFIDTGGARRALVCGADILSRVTDFSDPKSAPLFGDGAGAVVVQDVPGPSRLGPFTLRSDGARPELLYIPQGRGVIRMEGREVYRRAVDGMTRSVQEILAKAGVGLDEVDLLVAHQANARILATVGDRLGIDPSRVASNIDRFGNTSAASIPIVLAEAARAGTLRDGDLVVLTAFGAGFAWGAGILRWGIGVREESDLTVAGEVRG